MSETGWEIMLMNEHSRELEEFDAKQDAVETEVALMGDWTVAELINEAYGAGLGPRLDGLLCQVAEELMKRRAEEGDL